jgi:RimJ/RimL family protein N-acetyltransferase
MPFAVPWTDAVGDPRFVEDFVGFHERALTEWTPASWTLNLLVFADGHPVGTQSVGAEGFAVARTVHTGSWLGSESQGRGLGTEMRAAVLELAFTGLGARAARSGWLESGAAQSARVSARLGYHETGSHVERPRGEPVLHHDLLLEQEAWACPFALEIGGVEPCLPLFGAVSG